MPINWRTDYGVRLVYEISKKPEGTRATVRDLSGSAEVPYDYARTIVRDLVTSGIMRSFRGVGGGVELTRSPQEITILDVFRALGEPVSLALCTDAGGVCGRQDTCPMHVAIYNDLDAMMADYLGRVSFRDAVEIGSALPESAEDCR
ncbi:MAG: Rrf2 family transcriptional regulator [Coriobacteriia bacterium]|nr:Rrf2 family transcriptional regulator [Coriobacteriia bacterium]